jgi:hypothetical protein
VYVIVVSIQCCVFCFRWLVLSVHVLQCGVLWRYLKLFVPVNLSYVKHEVRDLCMLRLVHAFCEAAPMLLIQLYLLISFNVSFISLHVLLFLV